MSVNSISDSGVPSITLGESEMSRFITEPESRLGNLFRGILNGITGIVGGATGSSISTAGIDSQYLPFLDAQIHAQEQLQLVSLYSNIKKSEHETQMSAIRNVRVG